MHTKGNMRFSSCLFFFFFFFFTTGLDGTHFYSFFSSEKIPNIEKNKHTCTYMFMLTLAKKRHTQEALAIDVVLCKAQLGQH